ncbi:MAG: anthranilate phosphoribosyltransferase, partial [Candidatus Competibacteraceae bacterium]
KEGFVRSYSVTPEDFGFARHALEPLQGQSAEQSLQLIRQVLANQPGPARDIVALNAGAAVYTAGLTESLQDGVQKAVGVLATGAALDVLDRLVNYTQQQA